MEHTSQAVSPKWSIDIVRNLHRVAKTDDTKTLKKIEEKMDEVNDPAST